MTVAEAPLIPSVRQLRRRFKPHKERLRKEKPACSTPTRVHRACSWIDRVEREAESTDHDVHLVSLWIAFNALYGQWDPYKLEPKSERKSYRDFCDRLRKLDRDKQIDSFMQDHKRLVVKICEDPFISSYYWRNPGMDPKRKSRGDVNRISRMYTEESWAKILDELLERVYLMRCQLVHGAATYGSRLNRTSLKRCVVMMSQLLPVMLLVLIEEGPDEDWGEMCYPPVE